MRLIRVKFCNLSSLVGCWEIDFTSPEYAKTGLFAIIGPTGSGKTTILDAICLALYGRTPRLENFSKTQDNIMSHLMNECWSEVIFESGGKKYQARWEHSRTKRSNAQSPFLGVERQLSLLNGDILATKLREVQEKTTQIIGMDFSQFTQSIMLAQGKFAEFLKSDPKDKKVILEKITSTEVYRGICTIISTKTTEEEQKQREIQSQISAMDFLPEQERIEKERRLNEVSMLLEKTMLPEQKCLENQIRCVEELEQKTKRWDELSAEYDELMAREKRFEPDRRRLTLALRAEKVRSAWEEYDVATKNDAELRVNFEKIVAEESNLTKTLPILMAKTREETQILDIIQKEFALELELIQKTREIDASLLEITKREREMDSSIRETDAKIQECEKNQNTLAKQKKETEDALAQLEKYRSENLVDERLRDTLPQAEFSMRERDECARQLDEKVRALAQAEAKLNAQKDDIAQKTQKLDEIEREKDEKEKTSRELTSDFENIDTAFNTLYELRCEMDEKKKTIDRLEGLLKSIGEARKMREKRLQEIKEEEEILRKSSERVEELRENLSELCDELAEKREEARHLAALKSLADLRESLEEGAECPLCGATHHPYVENRPSEPSEIEGEIKKLEKNKNTLERELAQAEVSKKTSSDFLKKYPKNEFDEAIEEELRQRDALIVALEIKTYSDDTILEEEIERLKNRVQEVKQDEKKSKLDRDEAQKKMDSARKDLEKTTEDLKKCADEINQARNIISYLMKTIQTLKDEIDSLRAKYAEKAQIFTTLISNFFDENVPDAPLDALKERLRKWDEVESEIQKTKNAIQKIQHENEGLQRLLNEFRAREEELARRKERIEEDIRLLKHERHETFGEKETNKEESAWREEIKVASARENLAKQEETRCQTRLESVEKQRIAESEKVEQSVAKCASLLQKFEDELSCENFRTPLDFFVSIMPTEERSKLKSEEDGLNAESIRLKTLRESIGGELEELRKNPATQRSKEEILQDKEKIDAQINDSVAEVAILRDTLEKDNERNELAREIRDRLNRQEREAARWRRLRDITGAAESNKDDSFTSFAQSLTFSMLLFHANEQLRMLNPRYRLLLRAGKGLQTFIEDSHQENQIRAADNLSGGETFLASLSLALGLTQVVSKNIEINSFFLDEGFGSLDDDALVNALNTLENFRSAHGRNKLIGIISHVEALKEKIETKIEVIPFSAGRSILQGPGVRRLD
ncbi:MAG: AAA family ATPase [Planctomycetia bacterium]|nr:AAA family ATPase [Planctomycetia bacterium]